MDGLHMRMSVGRRVSEAIGSWLHFEFCCNRAGLFSENSLKAAVGQVLSAFPSATNGIRAYADFPHDGLNPVKKRGRRREVDFALVLAGKGVPKTGAQVLLEIKWAESTHCTPESIFSDFLRLAVLKSFDPGARCIFVLAGTHKSLDAILRGMPFTSGGGKNVGIGRKQAQRRLRFSKDHAAHVKSFSKQIRQFLNDGFEIPESIVTCPHGLHPAQTASGTVDFQAIAWEVTSVSSKKLESGIW